MNEHERFRRDNETAFFWVIQEFGVKTVAVVIVSIGMLCAGLCYVVAAILEGCYVQ